MGGARRRPSASTAIPTPPLIVLGAGAGQLGAYAAARRLGVETIACDADPEAFCVREGLADRFEQISTMDAEAVEALARARARRRPDRARHRRPGAGRGRGRGRARPAAPARRRPPRRAPPTSASSAARSTAPACRTRPGARTARACRAAARVVVKPAAAQGQRGLEIVEPGGDLGLRSSRPREEASRDGRALCEEFVEGPELTVNAFLDGGRFVPLTVTDRERALAFGVATAHLYPSQHPRRRRSSRPPRPPAARSASTHGPTYTQVLLAPDGPRVMEVAARLGGGHDAELCAAALGVDLERRGRARRARRGSPGPLAPTRERAAVVRFLIAPAGRLVRVDGLAEARALPGRRARLRPTARRAR